MKFWRHYFKLIRIFEYTLLQTFEGALVKGVFFFCFVLLLLFFKKKFVCEEALALDVDFNIKLHGGFFEVSLRCGCAPVDLVVFFGDVFMRAHLEGCFWIRVPIIYIFFSQHIEHIICASLSISILLISEYFQRLRIVFYAYAYTVYTHMNAYASMCVCLCLTVYVCIYFKVLYGFREWNEINKWKYNVYGD